MQLKLTNAQADYSFQDPIDIFYLNSNCKTTLEDIGLMLDKFTLDSKAASVENMDPARHLLE
jgi:hypothetical protein